MVKEHSLCDFNSVLVVEICFMVWHIYLGVCSVSTCEECITCCTVLCDMFYYCQILLIDGIVRVVYILVDFLYGFCIRCWVEVWRSPNAFMDLSISPLIFISFYFPYFCCFMYTLLRFLCFLDKLAYLSLFNIFLCLG